MKLGIIGAMDIEVAYIRERMDVTCTSNEAGMRFDEGTLEGLDVVVAKCGVGKVAAASCAQLLVSRFGATHLINTGIAGAIDPSLEIGDIVVADRCAYYDVDVHHYDYAVGQVPGMPAVFEIDADMYDDLLAASCYIDGVPLEGLTVTGDNFICTYEQRRQLWETFHPLCCDMEGAAIGQVAHMNSIPFAVLRTISDKADGTTSEELDEKTAKLAARIVCDFAGDLAR